MHSCKVQSHTAVSVEKAAYEERKEKGISRSVSDALSKAQEQVMGKKTCMGHAILSA